MEVSLAADVKFDFSTGYTDYQVLTTETNSGVTIGFSKGGSNMSPQWLVSQSCLRVYAKNVLTFSCEKDIEAFKIFFKTADKTFTTGTSAEPTVTPGTYTESGTTGQWIGSSKSVTLTAGGTKGHARIDSIVVTIQGDAPVGTVPNPVISPSSAVFSDTQEVSIACSDTEAEIHYTLDGTAPDAGSTLYTGPFTLTETTTVKAIAVRGEVVSQVVTAQFDKELGVESISEFLAQPDGVRMVFNCPVTVIYQYDKHLFVQDEWGLGMRIFGNTGQSYQPGNVIPAGFTGTKAPYGGESELDVYYTDYFQPSSGRRTRLMTTITPADINTLYYADYVLLRNVAISGVTQDGNFDITDANGESGMGYTGTLHVDLPENLAPRFDMLGVISSHYTLNTIYQFLPIRYYVHGDLNDDKKVNVGDISSLYSEILEPEELPALSLSEGLHSEYELFHLQCDINCDGEVNVGDVSALYNSILK